MKAISAYIYRDFGGANGVLSSKFDEVLVPCPRGNIEIDENDLPPNLVELCVRVYRGRKFCYFAPYGTKKSGQHPQASGAFVYTCDARFVEVVGGEFHVSPVSLHDRFEA